MTRILLVDDHDVGLGFAERLVGAADDFPELPTPPLNSSLKWIKDPVIARRFLSAIPDHGWMPELILVDFEFVGSLHTGLSVVEAARRHSPAATVSVFSGQSSANGRLLFAAAAHHWWGVEYDLDKARTRLDLPALLCPDPAGRPRFSLPIRTSASLIDVLFGDPRETGILLNWTDTDGAVPALSQILFESPSSIERAIRSLAHVLAAFDSRLLMASRPDLSQRGASQEYVRQFVGRNRIFLADPQLPDAIAAHVPR